ncbi:MAG: hypothetical protein J1F18_14585 [Lachnospiraceae bacterium]|nr:hypothetical protein [Lachnospiraceae bacterium]
MLAQNRKAPAKKQTKAEYLLAGKLFCGLCGQMMIARAGQGKAAHGATITTVWARKITTPAKKHRREINTEYT